MFRFFAVVVAAFAGAFFLEGCKNAESQELFKVADDCIIEFEHVNQQDIHQQPKIEFRTKCQSIFDDWKAKTAPLLKKIHGNKSAQRHFEKKKHHIKFLFNECVDRLT